MILVTLAIVVATLSSNAPSPLYGLYQQLWGFSSAALTLVFATYAGGVLLAMFLVGPLSDRVGRRTVMLPSLAVVIGAALVFCFAENLAWLLAARLLAGIGTGSLVSAASAALMEVDPDGDRQRAAMIATTGFTAGAASGPALSSLALHFNWWPTRLPFVVVAAVAVVVALGLKLLPWSGVEAEAQPFSLRSWRPQRVSVPKELAWPFLLAATGIGLSWSIGSIFAALGPSFAVQLLGVRDRALAGLVVVGFQLCGGIAQVRAGSHSPRRMLRLGPPVMAAGLIIWVAAFFIRSPLLFVLGTVVAASGFGATFVGGAAVVNRGSLPEKRGEVVSALYSIGYLTMALPVLGVGYGADHLGLKPTLLLFTAGIVAGCALLAREARTLGDFDAPR
jgi:MFS family permease